MISDELIGGWSSSPPPMASPPSTLDSTHQDTDGDYSSRLKDNVDPSDFERFMEGAGAETMYDQNLGHDALQPTIPNAVINSACATTAQSSPSSDSMTFSEYGTPMFNGNLTLTRDESPLRRPLADPSVTSAPRAGPSQQPPYFNNFSTYGSGPLHDEVPTISPTMMRLVSNGPGQSGTANIRALGIANRLPYRSAAFGDGEASNQFGTTNYPRESSISGHRQNTFTGSPGTPNSAVQTPQSARRMPITPLPLHTTQLPYVSPYAQQGYPDFENMPVQTRSGARQAAVDQDPYDNYQFRFHNNGEAEAHRFWFDNSAFQQGGHHIQNQTLPNQAQHEGIVQGLFDSIYEVGNAKDNEGMIKPWGPEGSHRKNLDTLVLVEKACWKLLNRLIDHCGNGPCTAKSQPVGNPTKPGAKAKDLPNFWECLDQLNKELKERKSICKRLIAPDYVDQVVDDPTACGKRVQANKQLNKRKADVMAAGKGAMKEKEDHTDGEYDEGDGHDDSGSYGDDGDFEMPPAAKKPKSRKVSSSGKATQSAEKPKSTTGGRGAGLSSAAKGEASGRRPTRQGMRSSSSNSFTMPVSDTQKGHAIGVSDDVYRRTLGYEPYAQPYGAHSFQNVGPPQPGNYPQFHGQVHGPNSMNYSPANINYAQPNPLGGLHGLEHLQGLASVAEQGPFGNQFADSHDMSRDAPGDWENTGEYHQHDIMKSEFAEQ